MAVSAATERKLREAMQRLLDGVPLRTDGAITKENLAREADVSHASVYRATTVLADWDAKVALPIVRSVGEVRRDEAIAELQTKLRAANRRIEVAPVSRRVGYLAPMGSDWMVDEAGWDASWAW
jgi:hypothetical protein